MNHKLLVIGLTGMAVSVVCLTAGGVMLSRLPQSQGVDWIAHLFQDGESCPLAGGPDASSSLDWDGDDRAEISLPSNVHYHPGSGTQLILRGDKAVLSHVRLRNGHVKLDCNLDNGDRLDVTLPGREFRNIALDGSGNLELQDIAQHDLKLRLAGSGQIDADGKLDTLDVTIAGSGDARLGGLTAQDINITVAGSGNVEAAPSDRLSVKIAGSGAVTLKTEPKSIDTSIAGSGRIIHADGTVTSGHGLMHDFHDRDDSDDNHAPPPPPPPPPVPPAPSDKT